MTKRYDWQPVKEAYVEGMVDDNGERSWPSYSQVAVRFAVPLNKAKDRGGREHWTEQRAAFQSNLEKVRQDLRASALAKEAVELDSRALTVSKMGLQLVSVRLGEIAQKLARYQQALAAAGPDGAHGLVSPVEAREIETLSRAAMGWHQLGGRALGEVEVTRTEVVGSGGGPIDVRSTVRAELVRDDPERLVKFVLALDRSGLAALPPGPVGAGGPGEGNGSGAAHEAAGAGGPEDV